MASARLVALVIYDSKLFNRTGQVRRWADSVEHKFVINAKQAAPVRKGDLRNGIVGAVARIGPVHLQTVIISAAPHTMYVLRGTTGPIMSDKRWATGKGMMSLRAGKGFPAGYRATVNGQRPQNFMGEAAIATARSHPSLRGFYPKANF